MTTPALSTLTALPRVALAHLPTPLEPLPNLSALLGGPEIWIKRDDLTGLATGGNKTRKLEFLIAQALDSGADCVITAGSTQSNHARQTAAAAARAGLGCCLVIYSPDGQPVRPYTGNLLLSDLLGAALHWTTERAPYTRSIAQVECRLLDRGQTPYIIPYGGSNAYGLLGYAAAYLEVVDQAPPGISFDAHVFASSSGGTQAGLMLGAALAGQPTAALLGISVDRPAADLARTVADLATSGAQLLGSDWRCDPSNVRVNDEYLGGGYAVVGPAERDAIRLLARTEGILVDPVYTGRALAGLIDLVRRGAFSTGQRVLFWHTGGTAALDAFTAALT